MSSFDHPPIETIRLNDRDKRRIIEEIKERKPEGKGPNRGIRVTHNGYGYEQVTLSAREVIEALDTAGDNVKRIQDTVDELLDVLRRVRVG